MKTGNLLYYSEKKLELFNEQNYNLGVVVAVS